MKATETKTISAKQFEELMLKGNFKFTIVSNKTDNRFTYRIKAWYDNNYRKSKSYTVGVLTGSDNSTSYESIFYLHDLSFDNVKLEPKIQFAKKRISDESMSVKAFFWLWTNRWHHDKINELLSIYPSGKCAKCGRTLTDPASIERNLGPECFLTSN